MMNTRLLRKTNITGREAVLQLEPEFDFYRAGRVQRIELVFSDEPETWPSLRLDLVHGGAEHELAVSFLFTGVRELRLPQFWTSLHLTELEVHDLSADGLEGLRFQVIAHVGPSFICSCRDISVHSFRKLT